MTFEAWPAIIIGWPAILIALALCAIGLVRRKPGWLFVAAAVAAPFSLYLTGTPRFGWLGFLLPLLLMGAGVAVRNRRVDLGWMLVAPFACLAIEIQFSSAENELKSLIDGTLAGRIPRK